MENVNNKQWTPDTIRENVDNWSLAGDAGLLSYLQNFSENLTTRTKNTLANVDELFNSLTDTNIALANVTNEFMNLHHTQFIENRVYEEDEVVASEVPETKKTSEQNHSTENIQLMKKVMQDGLNILSKHFERVEVPNSDSEDESEGPSIIVRPKEFYMDRPLPYVIGSNEWNTCDHIGLKRTDSCESIEEEEQMDSDSSSLSLDPIKTPESTSESSLNIFSKENSNSNVISDDKSEKMSSNQNMFESSSVSNESDPNQKEKVNAKFAAELASKLGNVVQDIKQIEYKDGDMYGESTKTTKQERKISQPYEADLFADEPPPLDEVDESPLFGSISSENRFASSRGLFDDLSEDGHLWSDGLSNVSKSNIPTRPENARSSIEKDNYDTKVDYDTKKSAVSQGLFDDDSDTDDLFATSITKPLSNPYLSKPATIMPLIDNEPPPVENEPTKKKAIGGVPIFGKQNDILSKNIAKILKTPKQASSDSDEGEDYVVRSSPKEKPEMPPKDLIADAKEDELQSGFSLFTETENQNDSEKFKGLFDDEDDDNSFDFLISKSAGNKKLNTSGDKNNLKKEDVLPKVTLPKKETVSNSTKNDPKQLESFQDIRKSPESLFFDEEPPPLDNEIDEKEYFKNDASKLKTTIDLFKEIDDDLFKQDILKVKEKSVINKSPVKNIDIFSDNIFDDPIKSTDSLFDESEISNPIEKKPEINVKNSTTKSLLTELKKAENVKTEVKKEIESINENKTTTDAVIENTQTNLKNVTKKLFESGKQSIHTSSSKENIGKLSHNLNINVAALLPGSVRSKPNKTDETKDDSENKTNSLTASNPNLSISPPKLVKSISFDKPIDNMETLQSLTQERVRIPIKRRPSSRRARQQAIRASLISDENDDINTDNDDINIEKSEEGKISKEDEVRNEINDVLNGNSDEQSPKSAQKKSEKDDNDLFANKPEITNDNNESLFSNEPDIFKDTVLSKISEISKTAYDIFDSPETVTDELVINKSTDTSFASNNESKNVLSSFLEDAHTDSDIFSEIANKKSIEQENKTKSAALNLFDDDDIDDIFNINKNLKISSNIITDDIRDDSDIFGIDYANISVKKENDKKIDTLKQNTNSVEDLFGESDIDRSKTGVTADETKNKLKQKETKSAATSLFDDDEDDDLFKPIKKTNTEASQKTYNDKVETKSKSIPKSKKLSLFDDDSDDDLFGSRNTQKSSIKNPSSLKAEISSGKVVKKPKSKVVFDDPLMFNED